jgi:seryl-tRNA synthetase
MDNLNNDIMQALAQAYLNMLAESHTHEQLMKLSVEKLKELKAEYVKKIGEAEGEEKEKHQKELANIEDILASRKDDKEEVKEGKDTSDKKVKKVAPKNPHRDVPRGVLPDWMERRMDKWNTEEDAKPIKEVYRLTPGRAKVLDKADADAGDALHASVGSTDPKVKERAHTELGKSLRAEILRQMTKPEGKRTGAWAGTTDPELKNHLNWARKPKSQLGESAKEIVQNISEWMKTMKGKKNGKSK